MYTVYSKTRSGVIAMTEDIDLAAEIEKAPDAIKEIFKQQTLEIPDNSTLTIEQNTKAMKIWVVQMYHEGFFKKHFDFSKVVENQLWR